MATLQDLLAEFGLADEGSAPQTKTAAAAKPAGDEQVNEMLKELGLEGAEEGVEKVASANENNKGEEHMGLTAIYEDLFGEAAPVAGQEKTAAEGTENEQTEEVNEATSLFGELTSHYFNAGLGGLVEEMEKQAGSVEEEADQDEEQPLQHAATGGQLTGIIGSAKDPHMPANHSASSGARSQVMTGNTSPYSLKSQAQIKAILKRVGKSEAGDVGAYED